jgi:hypothetical protein
MWLFHREEIGCCCCKMAVPARKEGEARDISVNTEQRDHWLSCSVNNNCQLQLEYFYF